MNKAILVIKSLLPGYILGLAIIGLYFLFSCADFDKFLYSPNGSTSWLLAYFTFPLFTGLIFLLVQKKIHPASRKVLRIIGIIWLISTLGLITWNKIYWNYSFKRPDVFKELKKEKRIECFYSISNIDFSFTSGRKNLAFEKIDFALASLVPIKDSYYDFFSRAFNDGDIVAKNERCDLTLNQIVSIEDQILKTDLIDHGNAPKQGLSGNGFTFIQKEIAYAFLSLAGREISNDHYPYYEFLFLKREDRFKLISSTKFYYDVAGMEGTEFGSIILISSVLHSILLIIGVILVAGYFRLKR